MVTEISRVAKRYHLGEATTADGVVLGAQSEMAVGLLTGCQDKHYALAIAMGLVANGISLDVIGSDEVDTQELHGTPKLRFLNYRGSQRTNSSLVNKLSKLLRYYAKLIAYAARPSPRVLHILWNNELEIFDRTILMLYFKLRGKKVALTAHNVNRAKRDAKDSALNRVTLGIQYKLCDHVFVHTQRMKCELCEEFGVAPGAVTVIKYPINNAVPESKLTPAEARQRLGFDKDERVILFFGKVRPYKGIDCLLDAFRLLTKGAETNYRLLIVGEPKKGSEDYMEQIRLASLREFATGQVTLQMKFVPDDEVELYFKGTDLLVLPYREIFQSGVLFVSYNFGLPVVGTDVGSFKDDIVEGKTGFVSKPADPADLALTIEKYFASDLFRNLAIRRRELIDYAREQHSWNGVAQLTRKAYTRMLRRVSS